MFGTALPGAFYQRNESLSTEMRYYDGKPPETLRFGSPWPERELGLPPISFIGHGIGLHLHEDSYLGPAQSVDVGVPRSLPQVGSST